MSDFLVGENGEVGPCADDCDPNAPHGENTDDEMDVDGDDD